MSDTKQLELSKQIVGQAQRLGAEVAEAIVLDESELSAKVRLGEPEMIREARSVGAGIRVFKNGRQATSTTSNTSPAGLEDLVASALELASLSEPDELAGPPDPALLHLGPFEDLDLFDPAVASISGVEAVDRAKACESAALAYDPRIVNSEGGTFERTLYTRAMATSGGFEGSYRGSYVTLYAVPVIEEASGKRQRGSYWDARRHTADLQTAEAVGQEAARRAIQKLGATKIESAELPVVFDPDSARALLSLLCSCVSGDAIYKRTSYLVGKLRQPIASPLVTIRDEPLTRRGAGSRPFDGEGLPSRSNVIVDVGVLGSWLLDTYTGRKLGLPSTGNAARGLSAKPGVSPSNFVLQKGTRSRAEIIGELDRGLYVTHMMGFGFNPTTGDFSRGAEGFMIEKGELTHPVSEVTVSLGFDELWPRIDAVADDLDDRARFQSPSFRVSRMTIAGASAARG
ncbi:MAG: TldD/PmbA family protein [Deltaproteobacteria bacterium]|nr:TldD/PmbA family protein [Deltaproteobacteria bacterium]